eukprot:CAMPEP_0204827828 /NCGR_PEP_ID=MMETSP1346-20131115/5320_1 /ASSEMBLY_ACC=CAM_ASM_000771 /TAXON_ID=215587 /ORGANISM="Aplanochytrium stocchinoi, Strain GSBS06" /LENGTH=448 /DNA_ID=CAMNT_0051956447 /DNA_START=243 /DNA_END=1592 /DNA_ORIENTATION=+
MEIRSDPEVHPNAKNKEGKRMSLSSAAFICVVFSFLLLLSNGYFSYGSAGTLRGSYETKYSIVVDCGSTGSRVHIYEFKKASGAALPVIENEEFIQLKPGLSSYAENSKDGANSLVPLLDAAVKAIPKEYHERTPIFVGATAGLRLLPGNQAEDLLDAVRDLLKTNYQFSFSPSTDVQILSGDDEGKFAWIATNMLLGLLFPGADTVGVVDLGGGSVQMIRAVEHDEVQFLPPEKILKQRFGLHEVNLYVHSFLNYGLMAARKQILKVSGAAKACMPYGYQGEKANYVYGGESVPAVGGPNGNFQGCLSSAVQTLDLDDPCSHNMCTFDGEWAGKGTEREQFYMLSYIYERIDETGAGDFDELGGKSSLQRIKDAARRVCKMGLKELHGVEKTDPEHRPYLCMDMSYIYSLLNVGLGVTGDIHLAKKFESNGKHFEAAWPLGAAVTKL